MLKVAGRDIESASLICQYPLRAPNTENMSSACELAGTSSSVGTGYYGRFYGAYVTIALMHDNHGVYQIGVTLVMISNFSIRARSCLTLARSAIDTLRGGCTTGLASRSSVSECSTGNYPMPSNRSEYSVRSWFSPTLSLLN